VQQAFSSLYHQLLLLEVRSQTYERQLAQLRDQIAQIDDLKARLAELRERPGLNSSNSSKPPSSDPPQQSQSTQRHRSGRKQGGQPGHQGRGRKLKATAEVDCAIDLRPASCSHCGSLLLGDDQQPARLCRRQICWAHLKRDFQAMAEREGKSATVGHGLLEQTRMLFDLWHQVREGKIAWVTWQRKVKPIQAGVRRLLLAGTESGHPKTRHTCANILQMETCLWMFVRVAGVEPTNNNAERPLRRAVLWRKKSFGTQSEAGSRFVERILTVVTSLRQQGREVLDYLTVACRSVGQSSFTSLCLLPQPP
jgi:hypothetical protein